MWIEEADGIAEIFKGYLPYYLLVALPIFIIMSPVIPVAASHEFPAYRMQQFDLHTVPHGCRSASFNLEGRSLSSWSTSRHCVVARIQDVTIEQFMEIRNKAGALLLVLPKDPTMLTTEQKEHIQILEMAMSQQDISAPVYFVQWSPDFEDILQDLQHSFITDDKSGTALEAIFKSVSSNGYQIAVSASNPLKLDSKPVTLHGKLAGRTDSQTVVVVAHYDSAGIAPEMGTSADWNASGVVAVLELARIFSRLYSDAATRPPLSLLFLLTSTGHSLNYFSAKKWLEEQLDSSDATLLQDVSFVMCLDSLSSSTPVRMHVSKPPKAGGAAHSLLSRLGAPLHHKKINLADEALAWHHERFSIRRMTAFTLSALQSHKDPARSSVLDVPEEGAAANVVANVGAIARALASHVYNLTAEDAGLLDGTLYDEVLGVDEASIIHWYRYLRSQPRAPQVVTTIPHTAGVNGALHRALSRYLQVTASAHPPDKREPEDALYAPLRATLYVYSVKPAVFDLILTLVILAYLGAVYLILQTFPRFYQEYFKILTGKSKVQ